MKKMLISALFAGVMLAANGAQPKAAVSAAVQFDTIQVNIPSNVKIYKGDSYSVRIESDSKYAGVEWHVVDGKLVISTKYDYDSVKDSKVRIKVVTPNDSVKV